MTTRREQDDDILFRHFDGDILTPEEHARVEELMERELNKNRRRPSGGLATARDRMARMRERQSEQGMKRVEVTVPETRADEIRQIAATMRQEAEEKK
jgi:hypothetical protein